MANNPWDELLNAESATFDADELLDADPTNQLLRDPDDADDWQITKGLKQGWEQLEGIGGGLKGLVGEVIGDDQMREAGYATYLRNMAEANEYRGNVTTYKDVKDLNSAIDYALHGIGTTLPMFLPSLVTGGAGGIIGKQILGQAIKSQATKYVGQGVAKEIAFKKAAQEVSKKMVGKSGTIGSGVGGATGSIGLQSGMIYGDVREQTGESRADVALTAGAITGLLDAIPIFNVLDKLGVGKAVKEGVAKEVKESASTFIGKQILQEGGTEMLQTIGEQAAVAWVDENRQMFTPEAWEEIINAGILGALGGGTLATPGALLSNRGQDETLTEPTTAPTDDTDIGGAPAQDTPLVDDYGNPIGDPNAVPTDNEGLPQATDEQLDALPGEDIDPVNPDGTLNTPVQQIQEGDSLQTELDLGEAGGPRTDALDDELGRDDAQGDMLNDLIDEDAPEQGALDLEPTEVTDGTEQTTSETTLETETAEAETTPVDAPETETEVDDTATETADTEQATQQTEGTAEQTAIPEDAPEWVKPETESDAVAGMYENNDDSDVVYSDATGAVTVEYSGLDDKLEPVYDVKKNGKKLAGSSPTTEAEAIVIAAKAAGLSGATKAEATTTKEPDATTVDEPETATRTETELLFDGPTPIFTTPDLADDAVGVDSTGRIEMVILRETPEGNMIYGVRVDGVIDNNTKGKPREYKTTKGAQNRVNWHRNQGLPNIETVQQPETTGEVTTKRIKADEASRRFGTDKGGTVITKDGKSIFIYKPDGYMWWNVVQDEEVFGPTIGVPLYAADKLKDAIELVTDDWDTYYGIDQEGTNGPIVKLTPKSQKEVDDVEVPLDQITISRTAKGMDGKDKTVKAKANVLVARYERKAQAVEKLLRCVNG